MPPLLMSSCICVEFPQKDPHLLHSEENNSNEARLQLLRPRRRDLSSPRSRLRSAAPDEIINVTMGSGGLNRTEAQAQISNVASTVASTVSTVY